MTTLLDPISESLLERALINNAKVIEFYRQLPATETIEIVKRGSFKLGPRHVEYTLKLSQSEHPKKRDQYLHVIPEDVSLPEVKVFIWFLPATAKDVLYCTRIPRENAPEVYRI